MSNLYFDTEEERALAIAAELREAGYDVAISKSKSTLMFPLRIDSAVPTYSLTFGQEANLFPSVYRTVGELIDALVSKRIAMKRSKAMSYLHSMADDLRLQGYVVSITHPEKFKEEDEVFSIVITKDDTEVRNDAILLSLSESIHMFKTFIKLGE